MKPSSKAIQFLNSFSVGLLVPVLSLALLDKGCTLGGLAIMLGIYSATVFLAELPSGILADLLGRKRIFLLSSAFYVVSVAALLFLHGWWVIAGIVPWGLGRAFASGSFDALVIDVYVEAHGREKLSSVISQMALLETAGIAAGSVLGGFLPNICAEFFPALGRYDLNLIIKILLSGVIIALSSVFLKEQTGSRPDTPVLKAHLKDSILFLKKCRTVRLLSIGGFFGGFFISTIETYWQPAFESILADESLMWTLGLVSFACFGFASLGNIAMKNALDRFAVSWAGHYSVARILLALSVAAFALQRSAWGFAALFSLVYFLFGAANMAENALINRHVPSDKRASFLSFFSLMFQGGAMVSPAVSSILVDRREIFFLWFIVGALLLVISILIGLRLRSRAAELAETTPQI